MIGRSLSQNKFLIRCQVLLEKISKENKKGE